jgi:hypothetical protein
MPIIFYRERGRVLPSEAGITALKEWVESAPNAGEKGARALHVKSLHTARGVGAKTLSFLWLDVPFRAAGAAVRTGYQPGKTCPLCISLAAQGLSPRGKPLAVPARPSAIQLAEITPTVPEGGAGRGALESNHGDDMTEVRRITYELGKTVETTEDNMVTVLEAAGGVKWQSKDGGHVEPADGFEFVRVRASYLTTAGIDDVARVADSFMVQTESGGVYASLEESYSDEEELQSQAGSPLAEGESVEGILYFEVPVGNRVSHVIFDCSLEEEGAGLWLRWKIENKPGVHEDEQGSFATGLISSTTADTTTRTRPRIGGSNEK